MCVEIEAKLKVDSLREVQNKLGQLGARFWEEQRQIDYYFDDANRGLTKTDRCLRLRRQESDKDEKVFLTYKGAKEKNEFKKRQEIEIEIEIGDLESAERMLSALNYEKVLVFEKKRGIWRLGECKIALDELPLLGSFVEIEGPNGDKIADVQKSLGLADLPHIGQSYASLMEEKLHQLERTEREIFL